jgi:circadian clock protein KaiC
MTVIKVRASAHSKDLRLYEIDSEGITVGKPLPRYHHGILTADPRGSNERRTP